MTQDDVKDPAGGPKPAAAPGGSPPASAGSAGPPSQPGASPPAAPASSAPAGEPPTPGPLAVPVAPAATPSTPPEAAAPVAPEPVAAAPSAPAGPAEPAGEPVDEVSQWVQIGQVGSGRRLGPAEPALRNAIRDFASQRQLPGIGTLIDLARAHAGSNRGPSLGVDAFTELRSQLGRLVDELEAVAIRVGPVLFLKTSAKNQPGTALRWLHADERAVLREHPELLDHPGRLVANLRKRTGSQD